MNKNDVLLQNNNNILFKTYIIIDISFNRPILYFLQKL